MVLLVIIQHTVVSFSCLKEELTIVYLCQEGALLCS